MSYKQLCVFKHTLKVHFMLMEDEMDTFEINSGVCVMSWDAAAKIHGFIIKS